MRGRDASPEERTAAEDRAWVHVTTLIRWEHERGAGVMTASPSAEVAVAAYRSSPRNPDDRRHLHDRGALPVVACSSMTILLDEGSAYPAGPESLRARSQASRPLPTEVGEVAVILAVPEASEAMLAGIGFCASISRWRA